jgi:hypothetical protein
MTQFDRIAGMEMESIGVSKLNEGSIAIMALYSSTLDVPGA